MVFEATISDFAELSRRYCQWSEENSHTIVDVRLVWGTLAFAVSPRGASILLKECFPLSANFPVRMYGSETTATAYGIDGVMMSLVQRGVIKARAVFPPLAIGPNDRADSDVNPTPRPATAVL
jgi:hypothetical protein